MMNDIQQTTFDYMVEEYNTERPTEFKDANHFDLYTIHMIREILNMDASPLTKQVASEFIKYVTECNLTLHKN